MEVINTVGRRKTSVARLYLANGQGNITINKKPVEKYFPNDTTRIILQQPLNEIELGEQQYDIRVNVAGGGFTGQAEAIRLAIARALCRLTPEHRPKLKSLGFIARDSRRVERKKYGRRKARKRFQFSKR